MLVGYEPIRRLSSTSSISVLQHLTEAGTLGGTIPFCPQSLANFAASFPKMPLLGSRSMLTFLAGLLEGTIPPNDLITSQRSDLVIVGDSKKTDSCSGTHDPI